MSKYIIDIDDNLAFDPQFIQLVGAECTGTVRIRHIEFDTLEELNSDYINEHYGEMQDEAYQAGMDKAWEAAKRIVDMPDPPYWDVFGKCKSDLFKKLSASEAIAKLKVYDDGKRSDRIEVGDEVISDTGTKFIVTAFTTSDSVCGFSERGLGCFNTIDKLAKTGKHYDIASILEAMRE